jgi:hypothetical protein
MRWSGKSSAMCNRRANWPGANQLGASKIQPGQIAYFRRLADGENDSECPNHEATAERENEQQPNWEVRELDYAFTDDVTATDYVGNSGSD